MNVARWLTYRRPDWQRLEQILQQIDQQHLTSLSPEDLRVLGGLYRQVSADLAKAQMQQMGNEVTGYLQNLTLKAYAQVYQTPVMAWTEVISGYLQTLPRQLRNLGRYIILSLGIFGVGVLAGGLLYLNDSRFIETLLSAEAIRGVREKHQLWTGSLAAFAPLGSSLIIGNNLSVAVATFAGGIFGGLGTLYLLFSNGVSLGAIGLFIADYHLSFPFWAFVSAHSVPELSAIFLAGAAGLMIGKALILPLPYRRQTSLVLMSRRVVPLLVTAAGLLVIAGLIEGFFSPNDTIAPWIKYSVGLSEISLLLAYGWLGGRKSHIT